MPSGWKEVFLDLPSLRMVVSTRLPRLTIDRSEWEKMKVAQEENETVRNDLTASDEEHIIGAEGVAVGGVGER